jgi:hypothetical protein
VVLFYTMPKSVSPTVQVFSVGMQEHYMLWRMSVVGDACAVIACSVTDGGLVIQTVNHISCHAPVHVCILSLRQQSQALNLRQKTWSSIMSRF